MSEILTKIAEDIGTIKAKVENIERTNGEQFKLLYEHQKDINELKIFRAGFTRVATVLIGALTLIWSVIMVFIRDIWNWIKG